MCTAIKWKNYFGRTLDFEHGFGEKAVIVPRNFPFEFRKMPTVKHHPAIIGTARVEKGYPLFFDAANEEGVAMAGLNFSANARFFEESEGSVASFELIPFILGQAKSTAEARKLLEGISISSAPFSKELSPSPLHWIIADKKQSLTAESTNEGLRIYENPVGVLTNDPPFPYQMTHLSSFMNLSAREAVNRFSQGLELRRFSRGMGAIGLPGDHSSASRFVRASFTKENAVGDSVSDFFHIISSVEQIKGCVILENDEAEYTRYTSCIDLDKSVYYYTTHENRRINAVTLKSADSERLLEFPLKTSEDICYCN